MPVKKLPNNLLLAHAHAERRRKLQASSQHLAPAPDPKPIFSSRATLSDEGKVLMQGMGRADVTRTSEGLSWSGQIISEGGGFGMLGMRGKFRYIGPVYGLGEPFRGTGIITVLSINERGLTFLGEGRPKRLEPKPPLSPRSP